MINRIVNLNLKSNNEMRRLAILFLVGILVAILQLRLINMGMNQDILIGDIIVLVYGGLEKSYNLLDIFSFILWLTPHIFVLYMINLSVIDRVKETSTLVLTRVKNKYKWFAAFNVTVIIKLVQYYCVLFIATLLVGKAKLGNEAFMNTNFGTGVLSNINTEVNQYMLILWVFVLNVCMLISIQVFLNNLYYIFIKSNESTIAGLIFILLPVFIKSKLYRLTLIDNGMFRRFEIFNDGLKGLNIMNSLVFMILFIIINFVISLVAIRKRDINEI